MRMASIAPSANAPLPAWKRLGLKLKFAQELPQQTPEQPITKDLVREESPKRKRNEDAQRDATPIKKPKTFEPSPITSTPSKPSGPHTPLLRRQKSVTFTPETKTEDGDSIKQLFNAWVAEQNADDQAFADFCAAPAQPALQIPDPPRVSDEVLADITDEKEKRVKRVKAAKTEQTERKKETVKIDREKKEDKKERKEEGKKEKTKDRIKAKAERNPQEVPRRLSPSLAYLRQYHEDRGSWKFNKNHQTYLLKHAFNTDIIPIDYSELLYVYIIGLQGGVRKRVRDEALAVKVKDLESGAEESATKMDDALRMQREYEASMAEYIAQVSAVESAKRVGHEERVFLGVSNEAMKPRAGRRMRAERIIVELASSPEIAGPSVPRGSLRGNPEQQTRTNDGAPQKQKRKRKSRTAVVDDSSSSSESDTSSDESSDEEEAAEKSEVTTKANDTSSSSSSSESSSDGTSSEEESDSESDSSDDSD